MEKIAIFDTTSGGTPQPPIETPALSMLYGQYATTVRRVSYSDPISGGFCNLCGGGNNAVGQANNNSVQGNNFPAGYDIQTDFYIAWGTVVGTPEMAINLYEDGSVVESWLITSGQLTTNSQRNLAFSSLTTFGTQSTYALRFTLSQVNSSVEITGWSLGVSFRAI